MVTSHFHKDLSKTLIFYENFGHRESGFIILAPWQPDRLAFPSVLEAGQLWRGETRLPHTGLSSQLADIAAVSQS